ncbi:hypothetical protein IFM89_018479 [Coptis chinensis]|uniref:Uncharacterized protein n=1 Tax=Coptis chinensis TaxID=261450 RepID=A0A835M9E2_9MAGN|nr:hypothetical protein IFM89_018479 [Coptis chinensis]
MIEKPKLYSGLGVRNLQHTNLALLSKKGWEVIASDRSLWIDIIKAKYLRNQYFLTVCPKPHDSRVWRDILKARTVLTKGLGWEIGNGSYINLFTERWIPSEEGITALIHSNPTVKPLLVSDLIDSNTRKWRSN